MMEKVALCPGQVWDLARAGTPGFCPQRKEGSGGGGSQQPGLLGPAPGSCLTVRKRRGCIQDACILSWGVREEQGLVGEGKVGV